MKSIGSLQPAYVICAALIAVTIAVVVCAKSAVGGCLDCPTWDACETDNTFCSNQAKPFPSDCNCIYDNVKIFTSWICTTGGDKDVCEYYGDYYDCSNTWDCEVVKDERPYPTGTVYYCQRVGDPHHVRARSVNCH